LFCFLLIIESLFVLFPFDFCIVCPSIYHFWLLKGKQNTKNINDQKETEHKDYQWSKGNKTQRLSMIKRKQYIDYQWVLCFLLIIDSLCALFPFDHWWSFFSVSFWSLIVFVLCFLLIIDSLFALFPFDHW
jgi:hypothetical protein